MKKLLKILNFIINHPISSKRKIKFLFRFFYWQIFSKLKLAKTVFNFVDNTKLNISKGQTVATGNFYVGLLEFNEMAFVAHFLRPKDTFFDIGANIGAYTVLASGVCGATTFAFEPVPKTFKYLQKNIELNSIQDKVVALNIGLADKSGFLNITTSLDAKNHITTNTESDNSSKIKVQKLDEFKKYNPILLKADVEGYEEFILKGASDILKQTTLKAIIIEVNNERNRYNISKNGIHNLLSAHGFELYEYHPFKRELKTIKETLKDNRLYIRDFNFVSQRIKQAKKINVAGIYI